MDQDLLLLTAGDIKQYFYCPRIVFFRYLIPHFKPTTYKMVEGKLRQIEETQLEKRRSLVRFGIKSPWPKKRWEEDQIKKCFNLRLTSERLGLSGSIDMAIVTPQEAIPVDFKDGAFSLGDTVALHHKYQLLAYGLLLEDTFKVKCERGFVYSLEDGSTKMVHFSQGARDFLLGKIRKIRRMLRDEIMPEPTPFRGRCKECEFKPLCIG